MRFFLFLLLSLAPLAWADPVLPSQDKALVEARPASVSLYGGIEIAKCLVEKQEQGVWIVWEGHRYWYLNNYILKIVYLEGAPDAELTEWLKKANEARALAEKQAAESDERRRREAEKSQPSIGTGGSNAASDAKTADAGSSKSGANDKKRDSSKESSSSGNSSGGQGSSGNDRNPRKPGADRDNPVRGPNHPGVNRADDWRVLKVDRKQNEMLLRNRLFKQEILVQVRQADDLENIHAGDILYGNLGAGESTLVSQSGQTVELTAESVVKPGRGIGRF